VSGDLPSTWFTSPPHWQWLIILYFFVGGLAGGSFFIAALIDLFGRPEDRPLSRLGYYIAFPAVLVSGVLLILDLGRPLRFWHMMVESNTWQLMFKPYSPMSVGSWSLVFFGLFSFAAFLAALADARRVRWPWALRLRPPRIAGTLVAVLGGALGFFVASYTGVLLAVTNRPIWADTPLLGLGNLANVLAATAVALEFDVPLDQIAARAAALQPARRRGELMRLPGGITLIDDSYNSSPAALRRALDTLRAATGSARKVAVLGEMLELGAHATRLHEESGAAAAAAGLDLLVAVGGPPARALADAAIRAGMPTVAVLHVASSADAVERALQRIRPGDLVLVKGSRGIGTDAVVERLKAEFA